MRLQVSPKVDDVAGDSTLSTGGGELVNESVVTVLAVEVDGVKRDDKYAAARFLTTDGIGRLDFRNWVLRDVCQQTFWGWSTRRKTARKRHEAFPRGGVETVSSFHEISMVFGP
jgi:hypothetical protein